MPQLSKITELSHASLVAAVKKVYGEAMPEEQVRSRWVGTQWARPATSVS
jgi:hypothetical protein